MANAGTMEINDAAITGNINGGIYIQSGDAQLDKVVFSENTGNRPVLYIAREAGKFEAKECTIDGNKVENNVLHIYGGSENNVRKLDQCTISGNENLSTDYRFGNIVCLEGSAHVSFTGCKIEDNSTISASGVATVSVVQAIVTMSDSIIAGNEAKGTSGVGGIKQASSQSKITLDNVVITENRTTNPRGSAGGVYVTFGEFNLKSGAVYSNYSNGNLEDFRFSNNAHWTLAKASGMKDNFLMTENVFDEQHDNYTWLANPEGSSAKMQLDDNVSWNNTAIKGMQGKNELHIWAFPRRIPEGVYISGAGDDANDGYSAETAVKTLERALAALDEFNKGKGDNEKSNTIYVVGTITIREETSWNSNGVVLKRDPSGRFKSVMVIVEGSSGVLTMKNITLDGGAVEGVQSYGLVKVVNKGELIIDEGAVLQNSMKSLGNQFEGGGGVYISGGKVTLKEKGKLTNNSSHNGGAISLMSDSTFIMDGGEISNNTTDRSGQFNRAGYYTSGGGVFIGYNGKMVMNGGSISGNTSYDGGGISLGGPENDVFIKYGSPVFEMNGGTIDSNEAYSSGGGIFVQMNCVATVYGGYITNNHTRALGFGGNFGGGGVYVNGGKDSNYQNGLLQLYKVEITGNQEGSGTGSGAALAGCPTSRTKIYLTNGGVIHENGGRNDLYLSSKRIGGYSGTAQLVISPYMLGGGAYHWTDDEGNELPLNDGFIQVSEQNFYARTPVAGDAVTGLGKIKTYITGNTSGDSKSSPGAAIGSNGDVIIGEEPEEVVELTVEKNWDDSGYENHRPEYVDIRILQSTDGENFTDIGFVRLYRKDNWEKATLKDLPKQDEEGNEFIYKVAETPNGYDSIVTEKEGENSFVVTNTPTYALTLKKKVEGPAVSDTFEFKITLSQEDDSLFTGEVDVIRANGNQGKLSFENGEATVRLGGGESLQLKNLQPGMTYKIEETNNGGAKETSMTIDGNLVDTAEGSVQLGGNVNVVTFTNTFEEEKPATGNLSIQKVVAGTAGEKQRAFRFRISLDDQSISGRFGGLNFDGGISEEFALQDQQSRSITDLPAGTGYTVEELGAEELRAEAYEITFEEEGKGIVFAENKINGVISEGESIKIICTNKKDTPDKPDEPDEPDKPDTPDNPGRPNRPSGGGNPPRGGDNPGGPGTTTTIETPDVPLADFPNEPVTEEIEEEEVPLAALPRTGDSRQNGALLALLGIAGLGALFSAMALHKRKED